MAVSLKSEDGGAYAAGNNGKYLSATSFFFPVPLSRKQFRGNSLVSSISPVRFSVSTQTFVITELSSISRGRAIQRAGLSNHCDCVESHWVPVARKYFERFLRRTRDVRFFVFFFFQIYGVLSRRADCLSLSLSHAAKNTANLALRAHRAHRTAYISRRGRGKVAVRCAGR